MHRHTHSHTDIHKIYQGCKPPLRVIEHGCPASTKDEERTGRASEGLPTAPNPRSPRVAFVFVHHPLWPWHSSLGYPITAVEHQFLSFSYSTYYASTQGRKFRHFEFMIDIVDPRTPQKLWSLAKIKGRPLPLTIENAHGCLDVSPFAHHSTY